MAYDWEDDRERFCSSASRGHVDSPAEEWLEERLDLAAEQAKAGNLSGAVKPLEEIRAKLVSIKEFERWDDGILCFSNLIQLIREMSEETKVPSEYQNFLDAAPSLRWDEDMTPKQKLFWYGSRNAEVGGVISIGAPAPTTKPGCVVVALSLIGGCFGLVALLALQFFRA
ncbi:hypothetical protein [Prosthecobacter sp.]|uniref:hypothetical protein n=1 Tax=Prosthecobacter sp. TaxID=1965333 RepID=UPI001D974F62|nr:hypothetical protein [Prosthecobacter sp.]MCB1278225.1 hypothetical protein [Prosthecobacter sp.]